MNQESSTSVSAARKTLAFGSVTHIWSDAFFALMVPLLPFIAQDLGLSYAQTGMLRTVFSGASGVLQIPAGYLAEVWGEFWLLIAGNVWVAGGLIAMGFSSTYITLLVTALLGGLGGGMQHPLATSMISRAYERSNSFTAIGTVNFAGDLGKMAGPALAAITVPLFGWRSTFIIAGVAGVLFMVITMTLKGSIAVATAGKIRDVRGSEEDVPDAPSKAFVLLSAVGMLDAATRGAALTFLPFILTGKGLDVAQVSVLFVLVFAGGAGGKLVLGWLGDHIGGLALIWSSKGLTAILLVSFLMLPTAAIIPLLVLFGFGLNGTSSVLYASVARLVSPGKRARKYGVYYTATEVASAIAPLGYGLLADATNLSVTIVAMAVITATILPFSQLLRRYL